MGNAHILAAASHQQHEAHIKKGGLSVKAQEMSAKDVPRIEEMAKGSVERRLREKRAKRAAKGCSQAKFEKVHLLDTASSCSSVGEEYSSDDNLLA